MIQAPALSCLFPLFQIFMRMYESLQRGAHIGAGTSAPKKRVMDSGSYANGLFPGHAYNITKLQFYQRKYRPYIICFEHFITE